MAQVAMATATFAPLQRGSSASPRRAQAAGSLRASSSPPRWPWHGLASRLRESLTRDCYCCSFPAKPFPQRRPCDPRVGASPSPALKHLPAPKHSLGLPLPRRPLPASPMPADPRLPSAYGPHRRDPDPRQGHQGETSSTQTGTDNRTEHRDRHFSRLMSRQAPTRSPTPSPGFLSPRRRPASSAAPLATPFRPAAAREQKSCGAHAWRFRAKDVCGARVPRAGRGRLYPRCPPP